MSSCRSPQTDFASGWWNRAAKYGRPLPGARRRRSLTCTKAWAKLQGLVVVALLISFVRLLAAVRKTIGTSLKRAWQADERH